MNVLSKYDIWLRLKTTFAQFFSIEILCKGHCCDEWEMMEWINTSFACDDPLSTARPSCASRAHKCKKVNCSRLVTQPQSGNGDQADGASICAVSLKRIAKRHGQALQWTPTHIFAWIPATTKILSLTKLRFTWTFSSSRSWLLGFCVHLYIVQF